MAAKAKWMFCVLTANIVAMMVFFAVKDYTFASFIGEFTRFAINQSSNSTLPCTLSVLNVTRRHTENNLKESRPTGKAKIAIPQGKSGVQLHVSTTTNRPPTKDTSKLETFQSIDKTQAWMYSAFFDHMAQRQGRPLVRLFGVVRNDFLVKVYCTFNTEDDDHDVTSTGQLVAFPDSHSMKYSPAYADCSLPKNVRPTHVSIRFQTRKEPTNRFQILYPGPLIRNFTVCLSILHSKFNWASQLIQSIETNRILGAEHIFLYNNSISPNVDQILRRYQEDGLVTVLHWPIPTLESWYYSQMTALNDCFYRNRNVSRFVVVVDTDEYIIPRYHTNWMELIYSVSPKEVDVSQFMNSSQPVKNGGVLTGCFVVVSSYFSNDKTPDWKTLPSQFPFTEEERTNIMKYKILTLSQFWRQEHIFPPNVRSKYIARPECVYISGIHFARKFTGSTGCRNINHTTALVHHYRQYNMKNNIVQDTSILKMKHKMYPRFIEQCKRFPNIFP